MKFRSMAVLVLVLVATAIGACATNVLVAWGCCLWSPRVMRSSASIATEPLYEPATSASPFQAQPAKVTKYSSNQVYFIGPGYRSMTSNWFTPRRSGSFQPWSHTHSEIPSVETIVEAGWPVRCVRMHDVRTPLGQVSDEVDVPAIKRGVTVPTSAGWLRGARVSALPIDPMPGRFALGSAFYFLLMLTPFAVLRARKSVRAMLRRQRGECEHCGYAFGRSGVCSECGRSVGRAAGQRQPA